MAFTYRKNLDGSSYNPALLYGIGKNDIVFTVGDIVRFNTSGFIDLSTANEQIIGVVASVVDANGITVTPDSGTTNTWTMNSANQTSTSYKYQVSFIPAFPHYAFSADSDTTIEQASLGKYFNANATSDGIVTSGESDTIGTLQFQLIGIDPDNDADTSKGLYRVVGSQMGATTIATRAA